MEIDHDHSSMPNPEHRHPDHFTDLDGGQFGLSVSHCYSGCGAVEIVGMLITVGLLALAPWTVAITTFVLAYLFGYALTAEPLIQEGMSVGRSGMHSPRRRRRYLKKSTFWPGYYSYRLSRIVDHTELAKNE